QGCGEHQHGNRVAARGEDGRRDGDENDGVAPPLQQLDRRDDADQLQGYQYHREEKGDAEYQHGEQEEAQVLIGVVVRDEGVATDGLQPLDGLTENEVGQHDAGAKEDNRRRDEGNRVLAFLGLHARGDEAPRLLKDYRGGKEESAVDRNLETQRQSVERIGHQERAVSRRR